MSGSGVPERPPEAVRVLHTSDWHLGVSVRGEPRSADHDALIDELVGVAAAARPDLILHTGDLFDGHRPPMHEFGRAIRAVRRLAEIAPVALLAGNHDSPVALEVLAVALADDHLERLVGGAHDPLVATAAPIRVHPKPTLAEAGAVTTYPTQAGPRLRLVALPFVHQNRVVKEFAELAEANATYNDNLRKIIASYTSTAFTEFDPSRDVAVFASHVHVRDARTSSEKTIHIAEDYATDPAHFEPRYGYLAFGHIHVPQPVADGRGRYAGSLLEVDFGEEGEQKQILLADMVAGRPTKITEVPLTSGRRLHRVRGPLSRLADLAEEVADGIVEVTVIAEPQPRLELMLTAVDEVGLVVGGESYDTLSSAVAALFPSATIVGVIDGRSPSTASIDEIEVPPVVEHLGDTFRAWLSSSGAPLLAAHGAARADAVRITELFDELHAAVTADAPTELAELVRLAELG